MHWMFLYLMYFDANLNVATHTGSKEPPPPNMYIMCVVCIATRE